jgi:predicted 3-demethylubiquinone-9 3-methyltransferase (glyoxalase superfamily)
MQKIATCLWFNNQAEEAVQFYTSLFKDSSLGTTAYYGEGAPMPKGSVLTIDFKLENQDFIALNGGPHFTFNPSISFSVMLEHEAELDTLWAKLSEGGSVLMPFQKYDWSEKYGWLSDKYGVSWQLGLSKTSQAITPSMLFVGEQYSKAEEAMKFYTSLFEDSSITQVMHNEAKTVQYAQFILDNQAFTAMDSNAEHQFGFNEAVSFFVLCDSQEEVNHFWKALSAHPQAEQCGWLKDKFGVSWQIVPKVLLELLRDPDEQKSQRVMSAMLQMKKLDIAALQNTHAE